jgi:poly(hydroxyalkanoate) depolymerase family esterase
MTIRPMFDMMEATRLTREGRLTEAMAVLQGARSGGDVTTTAADGDHQADVHQSNAGATLDMVPPSKETGSSWTVPLFGEGFPSVQRNDMGRPSTQASGAVLDRSRKRGSANGLERLLGRGVMPAPLPLPEGARFDEHTFANEAGGRTYKLYVPSSYIGKALPLLVMLHGCTQSPDDFAAGTRMNNLAEEHTFLVAYPAQPRSANASKCWNWFKEGEQRRGNGEPSLIAGITRQIMHEFPVESGRVYVAGLSAGGAAAAILGITYPDLYAGIGVHSGLACGAARDMPSAFAAMRQGGAAATVTRRRCERIVPTIVFHGDGDRTVNPVNGDQIISQSKAATNLATKVSHGTAPGGMSYTRTIQTDDTGQTLLEQWILHGAGHAWSGGSTTGSYTDPRGPDASREMVRFFLQRPTTAAGTSVLG